MNETMVTFSSGKLLLEGARSSPSGKGPFAAVLVCHPHPSFGGSMDNNVVKSICEALFDRSIVTLRFNFRGVGKSQGQFGHGIGEQDDVKAAIAFLAGERHVDPHRIGLAGYSAGAVFGTAVAVEDARVQALAAISLPLGMTDLEGVKNWPKPKLFIAGSKDDFAPGDELTELCRTAAEPKECAVIEGADHFWQGYEETLAKKVVNFFSRALNPNS